ncbi:hypothetical protein Poly51_17000 [Rubripirellula tenax]|uniref:DUF1294 domain-containing protein n=1 Tax=Rubripirellula tenax TaxID=2528015 RepID=A0A5C6FE95_9BACT|nr:DUF1294 domain-containing protein [Rubripirellula tenax]TWU58920.1 hypothetical protein Poly51_17000 [Rubripirellula tenax]
MKTQLAILTGLSVWIALASLVAAWLYVRDKSAARADRQRVPEKTLLLWCLVGGWPGGWIAGRWLRHKSSKLSYRVAFMVCVIVNVATVIGVVWMTS